MRNLSPCEWNLVQRINNKQLYSSIHAQRKEHECVRNNQQEIGLHQSFRKQEYRECERQRERETRLQDTNVNEMKEGDKTVALDKYVSRENLQWITETHK